jgi:dipeptidyl aminopeptidase/acylaminoacyl peptidase
VLSPADGSFLLRHESPSDPPNHAVLDVRDGSVRNLTRGRDPSPELRAADRRVLRYTRAVGVPLAAVLHVPPGRVPGERLPLVLWAYPTNHHDSETTDQLPDSSQRFLQVEGLSPLLLATQGYAVLSPVAMPVVGDPDAANDSFVEQTVENARAAVAAAVAAGVADPDRVAVIGHSYGAFMAVTLLVHTDLFRAGVAMSGSYNRTLTPLGFQTERLSLWEAPATYLHMSPFLRADRLAGPVLLIHGERDERPGTPVEQSRMLYDAIRATNGTARLVVLPFEGHVYRARESVLHVLAEMVAWLDRHVKPPRASYRWHETATAAPGGSRGPRD